MDTEVTTKRCSLCKERLPVEEFRRSNDTRCRDCYAIAPCIPRHLNVSIAHMRRLSAERRVARHAARGTTPPASIITTTTSTENTSNA